MAGPETEFPTHEAMEAVYRLGGYNSLQALVHAHPNRPFRCPAPDCCRAYTFEGPIDAINDASPGCELCEGAGLLVWDPNLWAAHLRPYRRGIGT